MKKRIALMCFVLTAGFTLVGCGAQGPCHVVCQGADGFVHDYFANICTTQGCEAFADSFRTGSTVCMVQSSTDDPALCQ